MFQNKKIKLLAIALIAIISFNFQTNNDVLTEKEELNVLTKKERRQGWQLLFDGKSTSGWHNYLKNDIKGWKVNEGILYTEGKNGDIVTNEDYGDFELKAEWKINEKGNSGIFYFVVEDPANQRIHQSGPEFQIIDNLNYPQKLQPNQVTGSASDVLKPYFDATNPVGEWNSTHIVANKGKIQHWLNGKKILEFDMNTTEWKAAVQGSKFADFNYAKVLKGKIGLQDHGDFVAYRNLKIRKL